VTDAELEILQILWQRGPGTVREVQEELDFIRPTGYTTVLKMLQIMTEKRLVARDKTERAHVYRSNVEEHDVQEEIVGHLLERVFAGSASKLVLRALSAKSASRRELNEIRALLDSLSDDLSEHSEGGEQ
jgi:predicted transcriptional regulator